MGVLPLIAVSYLCGASPALISASNYSNKWAGVRGVNYVPSYSRNPVQTWMDYNKSTVERELGYAKSIGMNTVRVFMSFFVWYADAELYLSRYDHFVASCAALHIRPLVVLFDDDFFEVPGVYKPEQIASYLRTGAYRSSKWMANPGMYILEDDAKAGWTLCNDYISAMVGGPRANDSRILGYDVMNEPHRSGNWSGGLPVFIQNAFEQVGNHTTVEYTIDNYSKMPADTESFERGLSWHNYWEYGHWQSCKTNAARICNSQQEVGTKYFSKGRSENKPVLVSEIGQFDCCKLSFHRILSVKPL